MKLTREQVEAMLADGRQMDSAILARELLAAWDARLAEREIVLDAMIKAAEPYCFDRATRLACQAIMDAVEATIGDTP